MSPCPTSSQLHRAMQIATFSIGLILSLGTRVEAAEEPLAKLSSPTAPAGVEVINAGRGGNNTRNLLLRLEKDVLTAKPSLVILLVGGNDFLNSKNAIPEATYRENLRELIRRIRGEGAALVLLTMAPVYDPYLIERHSREFYGERGPSGAIRVLNEAIREIAKETKTPLIDLHATITAAGGASERADSLIRNTANSGAADGIHLTPAGYQLMARTIYSALAEHKLGGQQKIVCFGDSLTFGASMRGAGTTEGDTYPAYLKRLLNETPLSGK